MKCGARFASLLLALIVFARPALATIHVTGITGASNWTGTNTAQPPPAPGAAPAPAPAQQVAIYGGMAGTDCSGTGPYNEDRTCNNCGTNTAPCNTNRISDGVTLSISFYTDNIQTPNSSGYPVLQFSGPNSNSLPLNNAQQGQSVPPGTAATAIVQWQTVCNAVINGAATGCVGADFIQNFSIGFSTTPGTAISGDNMPISISVVPTVDNSGRAGTPLIDQSQCTDSSNDVGACDFKLFPGDSKAYITNIGVPSTFPTTPDSLAQAKYSLLRFFITTDKSKAVLNGGPIPYDASDPLQFVRQFPFTTGGVGQGPNLGDNNVIDNLTNGTTYYFSMATVDQAMNMSYFDEPGDSLYHTIMPGPVEGILADKYNCFIATAAYGSPFANKVETFRQFRDKFLLPTQLGKNFVRWYYKHSPYWADQIRGSTVLRAEVRAALWPLWLFSEIALKWGALSALLLYSAVFALGLLAFRYVRRSPRGAS